MCFTLGIFENKNSMGNWRGENIVQALTKGESYGIPIEKSGDRQGPEPKKTLHMAIDGILTRQKCGVGWGGGVQ